MSGLFLKPVPEGLVQIGVQRLRLVGALCDRTQTLLHALCQQRDRLSPIKMLMVQNIGPGFVPGPIEVGVARGVNRARVAGQDLLFVDAGEMLEVRHHQLA